VLYGGVVTEGARQRDPGGVAHRSTRRLAWLAWSLAALCVGMLVAGLGLYLLEHSREATGDVISVGTIRDVLIYVSFLTFAIVGAMIASRRPSNPIGWICLADGILWMLLGITESYSLYREARPNPAPFAPWEVVIAWLSTWLWAPALGLFATYLLLLFPDGRLPSRRWRPLAWLSGTAIVSVSFLVAFAPGPLQNLGGVRNPFGLEGHAWVAGAFPVVFPLLPLCILGSALSVVLRYRRSGGEERQQIKWIAFAASVVCLLFLIAAFGSFMAPVRSELLETVAVLSYAGVPIALGFAVLKYRLYDIEVVINRALVYGSLTALLLALYFGGVATTQAVFRALTGQEQQPQLAVVASTLVIAALFAPLRRRVQGLVDRRFYRRNYDATRTLEAFSARLRDETDLDALNGDLVGVIREAMQPAHVSLWLRPEVDPADAPPE
jgi:hypothetical protein